jgi:hypothetical protein
MRTIESGELPRASSMASAALSAARSFRRQHRDVMSSEAKAHVDHVVADLEALTGRHRADLLASALDGRSGSAQTSVLRHAESEAQQASSKLAG